MLKVIPSNAPRFVPCPASVGAEAPFPRSPGHPVQQEGIALHWATERVLMSWLPINTLEPQAMLSYLNQPCPENGVIITDEMVWAGTVYLECVWERAQLCIENLQIEKQLSAHNYIEGLNGRTDAMWRSVDHTWLSIFDLKFGYKPKTAFENWQLVAYALGAVTDRTQVVELIVVQPRGVSASNPVKRWQLSIEDFWRYAQILIDAVTEARGPNPRFVAGPHCDYCKKAAECDTLRAAGMGALDRGLGGVNAALTNEQLGHEIELLDRAKSIVKARGDALEGLANARIQAGDIVPGVERRRSLSNRAWTLPDAQMIQMGGMFDVDIIDKKPCSPNQAAGRGLTSDVIDRFTIRNELAPKLVRTDRSAAREVFSK